jgi:Fur family ferric uptake transcriptional regulator
MNVDPTAEHTGLLRAAGLRVTRPRLTVLAALAARPHADVDTIVNAARQHLGTLSTQAVYDILKALTDRGLVRKIEPAGHPARFEMRVGDNHHHVVCRTCGATSDVDCAAGYAPCLTPSASEGFVVDEAEVVFWGFCPNCQSQRRESA